MKIFLIIVVACISSGCGKERLEVIWERQESHTAYDLHAVCFVDGQRGIAVGGDSWYSGVSLYTGDGGKTWLADTLGNKQLFALDLDEQGEAVAAGIDGNVFSRKEQDTGWSAYRFPVWEIYRGVAHGEQTTLLVGGQAYKAGLIVRLDEQFEIDTVTHYDVELDAVCWVDEQTAIAAGYGLVLRSEDAGRTWATLPIDGDHFRAIHFPSESVGYIAGYAGTILKTLDGGSTWEKLRNGGGVWESNIPFRAVFFTDEETGYLAGEKGIVWKTVDGGENWIVLDGLPEENYLGVYAVGSDGWLVGEQGVVIHFRD